MSRFSNKDLKYIYFHFYFYEDVCARSNMFYFPDFETTGIVEVANGDFQRFIYECIRHYYLYINDTDNIPSYENTDEWKNMFVFDTVRKSKQLNRLEKRLVYRRLANISVRGYVRGIVEDGYSPNDLLVDKVVKLPVKITINQENPVLIHKIMAKLEIPTDDKCNYNWNDFEFAVHSWYNLLDQSQRKLICDPQINFDLKTVGLIVYKLLSVLLKIYSKNRIQLTTIRWKSILGNNLTKFPCLLLKILDYCTSKLNNGIEEHAYTEYNYDYCQIMVFIEQLRVCLHSLMTNNQSNINDICDICIHINGRMDDTNGFLRDRLDDFERVGKYYLNQMIEKKKIDQVTRYIECRLFGITYFVANHDITRDSAKIEYILLTIEMVLKHCSQLISNSLMKQTSLLIKNIKFYYPQSDGGKSFQQEAWDCFKLRRELMILYCDALLCRMKLYYAIGWFKNCNGSIKNNESRLLSRMNEIKSNYSIFNGNYKLASASSLNFENIKDYINRGDKENIMTKIWINDWIEDSLWINYIYDNTHLSHRNMRKLRRNFPDINKNVVYLRNQKNKCLTFLQRAKYFRKCNNINDPKSKSHNKHNNNYINQQSEAPVFLMCRILWNSGLNSRLRYGGYDDDIDTVSKDHQERRYPYLMYNMSKLRKCHYCNHKHRKLRRTRWKNKVNCDQSKHYFCSKKCLKRWCKDRTRKPSLFKYVDHRHEYEYDHEYEYEYELCHDNSYLLQTVTCVHVLD